jgi:hypothetical protein
MQGRVRTALIVLVSAWSLLIQSTVATATVGYNGSGQWSSGSLQYHIYTSGTYGTGASNAMASWDANTDVSLSSVSADDEDIGVLTWLGYESDPYGFTQVCTTDACWDPLPWNASYWYAEVLGNVARISAWTTEKKQYVFGHEIGHALSLGHGDQVTELMYGTCCATYDTWGVNYPTANDAAPVNARY